jgi:HSP20 family protein
MPVLTNFNRDFDSMIRRSSPGYEINESNDKYQLSADVPGVKATDMTAQLENDGHVLHLSGGRKVVKDGQTTETKFEKRFTIGDNIDTSKLTADLSDGVLTVSAPKVKKEEPEPMKIAITEGKKLTDGKAKE